MNGIKATIILCITLLIMQWHESTLKRFVITTSRHDTGAFILDRSTHSVQYCSNSGTCTAVALAHQTKKTAENHTINHTANHPQPIKNRLFIPY